MASKNKKPKAINIVNRKAKHEYSFDQLFEAGIMLKGTEIKAIRAGMANLSDAFCIFREGELFIKSLHISEYLYGTYNNHMPKRERKLLLNKQELRKLYRKVREKGNTIIPYRIYISERGFAKVEIALAKGKREYDKRATIKDRENKRHLDRIKKMNR
ncbi:MAG: SsrA-binding protein SmpB [Bacteroidota bacterium]